MRVRHGLTAVWVLALGSAHAVPPLALPSTGVLFDDFTYTSTADLSKGGWIQRSQPGHPGLPGAQWGPGTLSLVADPERGCITGRWTGTCPAKKAPPQSHHRAAV